MKKKTHVIIPIFQQLAVVIPKGALKKDEELFSENPLRAMFYLTKNIRFKKNAA